MRFSILAIGSALVAVCSAAANPFHTPTQTDTLVAGKTFNITWGPTTSGTVTLLLKKGLSTNLKTVSTIASAIPNSGSYVWSIPSSLVTGDDYALEIDDTEGDVNYTPQFTISGVASASGYASSTTSSVESTSSSTVVSTHSVVKTSTIATNTVYASSTTHVPTVSNGTVTAGTNGTIAISTRVPTGGESSATSAGSTTTLARPTASAPSSAGSVRVAWGLVTGAVLAIGAALL